MSSNNSGYKLEYLEKYNQPPRKPTPKKEPKPPPRGCARVFIFLVQLGLIGLLLLFLGFMGGYVYLSTQLAGAIDQVTTYRGTGVGGTPRFYDRNGNLLFELVTTEKRKWLPYSEIPRVVVDATVAAEDRTFWTNPGFDPTAIVAAVVSNFRNDGRPVGASTITQQLVRHIVFSYEERVGVSYTRKFREIFLAFIMTQQRSKEEIIQIYLNEIYYGNLAYGIEAAAQIYFGKPAAELSLAEATFLAGLPQSPLELDPYNNLEAAKTRQSYVLDQMLQEDTASYVDAEVARTMPLTLRPLITANQEATSSVLEAPHFILYVQNELEKKYGPDALVRGGWQITTSLDLSLQQFVEQAAREQVALRQAEHDVSNAAMVVMKPATGEILSMLGSLDYFDETIDGQVNVAISPRQPGSSIKPLTYAAAMDRGWTTADVLWDVPIQLDLGNGETMTPVNYDGFYHGPVLLRDALANSYNIPPVQLIRDIGISTFITFARKMGIESLQEPPGYYGLALTLGGGEVTLLEMTQAYATLANQGQRPRLTTILKITDSLGNVIYDAQSERLPATQVLDARIAFILSNILDDDRARVPAMGAGNAMELPFPAAAKTGTTTDYRDNWIMGYTPAVVVGAWMGNSDGHPMRDSSGLQGVAPLWARVMQHIHDDPTLQLHMMVNGRMPPTDFLPPGGVEARLVCLPQGTGGSSCTATRTDYFLVGVPAHGIPRIGYGPNADENLGAWTLTTLPLSAEAAQRVSLQPLEDGTRPPTPALCVVNAARVPDGATTRLYLPIPPHYPDEVRARIWAQGRYAMAPPTVCPVGSLTFSNTNNSSGNTTGSGSQPVGSGSSSSVSTVNRYFILSPSPGETVSGVVNVTGTAEFDTAQVAYYKLEIGNGRSPTEWLTFGTTHNQPVNNGTLEQLQANALAPGDYTIRLVLVGHDGNFVGSPFSVGISVGG